MENATAQLFSTLDTFRSIRCCFHRIKSKRLLRINREFAGQVDDKSRYVRGAQHSPHSSQFQTIANLKICVNKITNSRSVTTFSLKHVLNYKENNRQSYFIHVLCFLIATTRFKLEKNETDCISNWINRNVNRRLFLSGDRN